MPKKSGYDTVNIERLSSEIIIAEIKEHESYSVKKKNLNKLFSDFFLIRSLVLKKKQ